MMSDTQRKLGRNQVEFMTLLRSHRGQWHRGSTWVWKAPSETVRLLEALERRGYAERQGEIGWKMTPAGREALKASEEGRRPRAHAREHAHAA